ncbi:ABC transporter permease [Aureicoccus marinus]|uniref:ABC transporter ATP-binding protein n=1 Tax=Aureicoccus marinus TaxID=754435 RepID=A0A2S7T8C7_9FLAO|nr:ABC transporter permease [Aureicoccus marinus]PQJ15818.1 ABC transporter ATP-binding protein [Aureicoccus marinus]
MFSRDTWKEIFQTISKNKLRTFLTGFTMALGIFIVVIIVGMTNGLKNTFDEFFGDDATNTFFLFPNRTSMPYKGYKSGRRIEFDNTDLQDIKDNFAIYLEYITPRISRGALVKYKNESDNYTTRAVGPAHQYNEKTIIMRGRYINENDIKEKAKVAVIGRLVKKDLFGNSNPIGEFIDVGGSAMKVVGVFQDDGGDNEERFIYIPYTTRQLIEKSTDKVDQIIVAFKPEIGIAGALSFEKKLMAFLKDKKVIKPADPSAIFIRNVADQYEQNQQFATVLGWIALFFAGGTMAAGIIAIGNIMLIIVKERTKELGIRKAMGATPKNIIGIILLEASVITTVSGFIGMGLGVLLLQNLGVTLEDYFIKNPYITPGFAIWSTLLLVVCGVLAGLIPARRAARIKPIVALRDE